MMDAEQMFDALGDPTRRHIFKQLKRGSRSVQELADGMSVSRPAVSQHLAVLRQAGLVNVRAEGTRRLYGVEQLGVATLRDWLDGFWDEALAAFKAEAEREASMERKKR